MAENKNMETWSAKVLPETKEAISKILSDDFQSANQMLEVLVERYNNPKAIDINNEKRIKELEKQAEKLLFDLRETQKQIDVLNKGNADLETSIGTLQTHNSELQNQLEVAESEKKNALIIKTDAVKLKILQWIADRESKARNKEIPVELMVMFIIDEIMIKGNKFAFDSVPDSIIAKIKKEVANVDA